MIEPNTPCPCGSNQNFAACCGPYLAGHKQPATAEQLMRSRYCAYVLLDAAYLLTTWHPATRPAELHLDTTGLRWLELKIVRTRAGSVSDDHGEVEFVARYKVAGKAMRLHENSEFVREAGQWRYVRGHVNER